MTAAIHTPRQRRSTLFPYTTLFRSLIQPNEAGIEERGDKRSDENGGAKEQGENAKVVQIDSRANPASDAERAEEDRKSTRLNSSHSQISYAVFCLKNKDQRTLNASH